MDWLSIAMEEYRSVRQESLEAISRQQTVLQFGFGSVGILIGLAIQLRDDVALSSLILLGAVPLFAAFAVLMWVGELARMVRAGAYLRGFEARIGQHFAGQEPPLRWEGKLYEGIGLSQRLVYRYRAILVVIILIALSAAALGLITLGREAKWVAFGLGASADLMIFGVVLRWYREEEQRLFEEGGYHPDGSGAARS